MLCLNRENSILLRQLKNRYAFINIINFLFLFWKVNFKKILSISLLQPFSRSLEVQSPPIGIPSTVMYANGSPYVFHNGMAFFSPPEPPSNFQGIFIKKFYQLYFKKCKHLLFINFYLFISLF